MDDKILKYFAGFYMDSSGEDIDFITEELQRAGIDSERSEAGTKELISKVKVDLKISNGKKLKEAFYKKLNDIKENISTGVNEPGITIAFRELAGDDIENLNDDMGKIQILEYLRGEKKNKKRE